MRAARARRDTSGDNATALINYEESPYTEENCIRFIECLPVPAGALATNGNLIKLLPWQKKLIRNIWRKNKPPRNEVLISVARRNGKSCLLAGIMAFLLFNNHKKSMPLPGSLLVSCALNKDQASIIFSYLMTWCSLVKDLFEDSEVNVYDRSISRASIIGVTYKAIPSSASTALGGNYAVILCDEIGHWKKNDLQLALRSGLSSTPKDRRLFLQASTVPKDETHFFWDELKFFLENRDTPQHYAYVRVTNPKLDDPTKLSTWKKANPSYPVLVDKDSFVEELEGAKRFPQRFLGFVAYRCNAQIGHLEEEAGRFVTRDAWDACKGDNKIEDGEQVVVGWDMGSSESLTCVVVATVTPPHRLQCYTVVPKKAIRLLPHIPFVVWGEQGHCVISTPDYVNKTQIVDHYEHLLDSYDVVSSMSDLFGYPEIEALCDERSIPLDAHTARTTRVADTHDGIEKLGELIYSQSIVHDGNPLLRYCIDNLRVTKNKQGKWIVDREVVKRRGEKIDLAIATMLCAYQLAGNKPTNREIITTGLVLE